MRSNCPEKCGRFSVKINSPFLQGVGSKSAKIMIVGEDPSQGDDREGSPFVGMSGDIVNVALREIDVLRKDVYITNAVKCACPGENKKPNKTETNCCKSYLFKEIERIKPNVILALGNVPMGVLLGKTGISKLKNNVYWSESLKVKVVPTYHPAYVLKNPAAEKDIRKGFALAKYESTSKNIRTKPGKCKYYRIKTIEKAEKILAKLTTVREFSFDVETSSLSFLTSDILTIQFCWKERTGVSVDWKLFEDNKDLMEKLKNLLQMKILKIGQNVKFDVQQLRSHGVPVVGPYFDTMNAHALVDDNAKERSLEALVLEYTDMGEYWKDLNKFKNAYCKEHKITKDEFSYAFIPMKILWLYGAKDADATFRIKKLFTRIMKKEKQWDFFIKHVTPFTPILLDIEYRGIKIDRKKLKKLIIKTRKELAKIRKKIEADENVIRFNDYLIKEKKESFTKEFIEKWNTAKTLKKRFPDIEEYIASRFSRKKKDALEPIFNMRSPKQLANLFFGMLNIKPIKYTDKDNISTDKEVMEILAIDHEIPLADYIVKYRNLDKYITTYQVSVYKKSKIDGRIHTSYIQAGPNTGRIASRDPNMQNIPKKAIDFKDCFVADPGYVFVKADLAQAEFRCWAHLSNDKDMLDDIFNGLDIHTKIAQSLFRLGDKKPTKEQRDAAKGGVFGMMYGIGTKTLAHNFGLTIEQANSISSIFAAMYPIANRWLRETADKAQIRGYVINWLGRKRRLPHIKSTDHNMVEFARRQSVNAPIQSLASDMNNHYMVSNCKRAKRAKLDFMPVATTHDENVYQVREEQMSDLCNIMKQVVEEEFPDFRCKMELEFNIGTTLGNTEEVKI